MAFGLEASETIDDDLLGFLDVAPTFDVEKFAGLREVLMQEAMQVGGGADGTNLPNPDTMVAEALDKMSIKFGLSTAHLGLRKIIPERGAEGLDLAVPPTSEKPSKQVHEKGL